jgi:hypothetical protein
MRFRPSSFHPVYWLLLRSRGVYYGRDQPFDLRQGVNVNLCAIDARTIDVWKRRQMEGRDGSVGHGRSLFRTKLIVATLRPNSELCACPLTSFGADPNELGTSETGDNGYRCTNSFSRKVPKMTSGAS